MKKLLLMVAVVIVVATGLSFGVSRWVASRHQLPVVRIHDAAWLKQELKLTEPQAREVEQSEREFQKRLNSLCATHCAARFALGDELAKPTVDAQQAHEHVEKMNAAQAEAEQATLAHILKVRLLLNEHQARRYSSIIRDQVCSMPMGTP